MPSVQGASASSSSRSSLTNLVVHDSDAAAVTSDAESSRPAGPPERAMVASTNAVAATASEEAGSSKPQPATSQGRRSGDAQRAVGFPIVSVKVAVAPPVSASASEGLSGHSSQTPAPADDDHGDDSVHGYLGSEALAAALRDANGSPGRAGITPYPLPGAHLAHIAAQGRGEVYLPDSYRRHHDRNRHMAFLIRPSQPALYPTDDVQSSCESMHSAVICFRGRSSVGTTSAQVASGQQHGPTVGMAMAVPRPPPAFLLAGQAAEPWLTRCGHQVDDVASTKQLAAGEDSDAVADLISKRPSADARPAIYAVTARADDGDENVAARGLRSIAADPDKAATERGGPVYLEQPDGSVQLKLLRNPLYRPPVDAEDAAAEERDVPLYQAILDGTYQARDYLLANAALVAAHGSCCCSCCMHALLRFVR